ncbi:zf-HC2 domain-containing protein [Nitriliruptor alkaliphilus]|uniref:zf-HC2 domain-containing protein n=1 Tax=Nitriliruptor alkaliphilus TaxID=427918 RepID=UPI0006972236|nr:zf-HC2 domain-containing protein [Nitriliruptor alkaliphilus]
MSAPTACREAIRLLWDYLDDDLSPDQHRQVEEHLSYCLRCCGELEFSREVRQMLHTNAEPTIPQAVQARLERLIDDVLPDIHLASGPVDDDPTNDDQHDSDAGAIT